MILSVGEILADMMGNCSDYHIYVGGAPFNVAVNAKRDGAKVGFIGKVGDDVIGRYLIQQAEAFGLDYLHLAKDPKRNTTLAFVTHDKRGERDFSFFRHDTADYSLQQEDVRLDDYEALRILHIGTLMLSENLGRQFFADLMNKAMAKELLVSVDVNFREGLFSDKEERNSIFSSIIESADILKMSIEEILDYTDKPDFVTAYKVLKPKGILFVTSGERGSYVALRGEYRFVETIPMHNVVDSTGAGDAFMGVALSRIDALLEKKEILDLPALVNAARAANIAGGKATQRKGAV